MITQDIITRQQVSSRGGGIEIKLDSFAKKYKGHRMTAYQNYLGGGLLGKVQNDCTIPNFQNDRKLAKIAKELAEYFHSLTNPDSEWESMTFEQNQNMPVSGY